MVLGHGFGGSARNFRPQARALQSSGRFVLFDARGHGRSDAPEQPGDYEPEEFVEDLLRLVDMSGADRAVVGGLSMGAGVALRFALEHPDRLAGLVLAAFPAAGGGTGDSWAHDFAAALDDHGVERAGEQFVWSERSRFDPKGAALIRAGFLEHSAHGLAHTLRGLLSQQPPVEALTPQLAALDVPALVMVGSNDRISLGPSSELAAVLPRATLKIVEDAGHVVNLAAPKEFNRALGAFLADV